MGFRLSNFFETIGHVGWPNSDCEKAVTFSPMTVAGLATIKSCSEMTWPSGVRACASPSRNGAFFVRESMTPVTMGTVQHIQSSSRPVPFM